jgi:hypothetical protein
MPAPTDSTDNITGRDDLIIAQALFEAAYLLRTRQPEHLQQPSNARDMERILFARYPSHARYLARQHLLGRAIDLGFRSEAGLIDPHDLVEFILGKDPGARFVGGTDDLGE